MGFNKFTYFGETKFDLSGDTISPETVLKGYTGHDKDGNPFAGTKEFKTQKKTAKPSQVSQNITPDSGIDGLSSVTVDAIPSNYTDTSGATADAYDIYSDKTAFVNGQRITGAYKATPAGGAQYNSGSSGCSASQLVIPCNFEPTYACVVLNSGTQKNSTIIAAMFFSVGATFQLKTSDGGTTRVQDSVANYWSYNSTAKTLTLKRPNTSYSWSDKSYRVFLFK